MSEKRSLNKNRVFIGDNKKVPAGARAGRDKEGRELKVISLQQWIPAHEPDTLQQPIMKSHKSATVGIKQSCHAYKYTHVYILLIINKRSFSDQV